MSTVSKTTHYDSGRPDMFSKIVGNKSTVRRITNLIRKKQFPKAVLVTGPTGSGKTTIARIICRALFCTGRAPGEYEPCGGCANCHRELNDTTSPEIFYSEYDAGTITAEMMGDFPLYFQRSHEKFVFDETQDFAPVHLRRMRKLVEGTQATLLFTTSHPDLLEDAFRNRFKSFEFQMKRPTKEEVADYLEEQFIEQSIQFSSREQLIRVAEELNCEMRPCAQFPARVVGEFDGVLSNDCLNQLFGERGSSKPTVGPSPHRFGAI